MILSWSGGKDSALALYELLKAGDYEIAALLTTVTRDYDRICMHGVRRVLLLRRYSFQRMLLMENMSPECGRFWQNI